MSNSSRTPVPSAVISAWISCVLQHLVDARLLDVEDLAAQREDRLRVAVAALLGRAAGGVALDDEQLGERRVACTEQSASLPGSAEFSSADLRA